MATSSTKEEDCDGSDKLDTRKPSRVVHVVSPYDPPPSSTTEEANQEEVYNHDCIIISNIINLYLWGAKFIIFHCFRLRLS
jgi:hypothetical protein